MKCPECGVDIYEGIKKCPYCKTLIGGAVDDEKFRNFDFKYTITSTEQVQRLRELAKEVSEKESKKGKLEKFMAERRKAKRAARRAARRNAAKQQELKTAMKEEKRIQKKEKPVKVKTKPEKVVKVKKDNSEAMKTLGKRAVGIAAIAICLCVLVWAVVALAGALSNGDSTVASYTYIKDNSMYMVYRGKNIIVSENVVSDDYLRNLDENGNVISAERAAKDAGIVYKSKDGKKTFFFENFDPVTNSGTLCLIENGKPKKKIQISDAVHNSVLMTEDGEKLLYLQSTDKNGDMGVLHYWEDSIEEPFKIATDIDHGTFKFSGDGQWAIFLQNLNRVEMRGDMYAKSLSKLKDEKTKLDTDVCKLFGSSSDNSSHIYAKDYDTEDGSFDIYAINNKGRAIRLGERTKKAPLMQKKKNSLFVYGMADDGTNNLYTVDIDSGKKEKIASGMNSILMLSKDEKTVLYDKVYTGKLADFYAYTRGKQPQKVAGNVVVDYQVVAGKPQMAVSEDCRSILYISEFESFKGGGTLNLCEYKNGRIVSETPIAEDVYFCYRAADGKFIFAKDYSPSRKVFDVYVLDGKDMTLLKEEVSPEMFGVSKTGDNIFYISNFNVEGAYGTIEKMGIDGVSEELASEVFGFDITSLDDVLFYKNLNPDDGSFDMYLIKDGKSDWTEINTAVDEILTY